MPGRRVAGSTFNSTTNLLLVYSTACGNFGESEVCEFERFCRIAGAGTSKFKLNLILFDSQRHRANSTCEGGPGVIEREQHLAAALGLTWPRQSG